MYERMKLLRPRATQAGLMLAAMVFLCPQASAVSLLFERALPTNGVNLTGTSRSNIAPVQGTILGTPFVLGDDFFLPNPGSFLIDSISVWIVGNCPIGSGSCAAPTDTTPNAEFSSIQLYGGLDNGTNGPVSLLSSTYTSTRVQYAGGQDYLSETGSGQSFPLFQITFSGLNLLIPGQQLYDFAVQGTPNDGNTFALHASTGGISCPAISQPCSATEMDVDNTVLLYQGNPLAVTFGASQGDLSNFSNGADVNVLVNGTSVPEPGTLSMFGLAGLGLAIAAVRRRFTPR